MDMLSAVNNSIGLVKRLREISKNIAEAEFKNVLADLASGLADAKLEAAAMKEELIKLKEENALLKKIKPADDEEPIDTKWGCYQFKGKEGLYCTGCWDNKRKQILMNNSIRGFRVCPVCNAKTR